MYSRKRKRAEPTGLTTSRSTRSLTIKIEETEEITVEEKRAERRRSFRRPEKPYRTTSAIIESRLAQQSSSRNQREVIDLTQVEEKFYKLYEKEAQAFNASQSMTPPHREAVIEEAQPTALTALHATESTTHQTSEPAAEEIIQATPIAASTPVFHLFNQLGQPVPVIQYVDRFIGIPAVNQFGHLVPANLYQVHHLPTDPLGRPILLEGFASSNDAAASTSTQATTEQNRPGF